MGEFSDIVQNTDILVKVSHGLVKHHQADIKEKEIGND